MNQSQPTYGGQAVIEGVMIRGQKNIVVAIRAPSGKIKTRVKRINKLFSGHLRQIPILRGAIALAETLYIGMDSLSYSASVSNEDEDEDVELTKWSLALMMLFSVSIAIGLFFILPLLASKPFEGILGSNLVSNIAEGFIRLAIFLAYIVVIGFMSDIRRVYMYHGAEHMTVHAREKGDSLTISNIRKYPTAHPRCGTAFLLTVMLVAIIFFSLIPREPFWWLIVSRIAFIPVIASISYEAIRVSSNHSNNLFVRAVMTPSLWLQNLTTKQPEDNQIEVAITAMNSAIKADNESPLAD